jgi:energy-coupling factor transport system ATP-binding protein
MRVYLTLEGAVTAEIPKTVREGRVYLEGKFGKGEGQNAGVSNLSRNTPDESGGYDKLCENPSGGEGIFAQSDEPYISLREVWFRYERDGRDVVRDLSLTLGRGEFVCVVGGNGTGKTTMLGIITGENRYWRGKARVLGLDPKKSKGGTLAPAGLAALPQDPQTLFTRNTIFDDLVDVASAHMKGASPEDIEKEVRRVCELTGITELVGFHPYDVSGGEQQRAGLAMALLARPKLLLLDEPTKGMDNFFKEKFAAILRRLTGDGIGVLMVSHDVEFCARYAERCALFFNGGIVSEGEPREFFGGNSFYTTSANRMSRGIINGAITVDDIITAAG